jgi:CarD family transcriptional regulator
VCEVKEISKKTISSMIGEKLYYTLAPVYVKGSTIYSPVDNKKVTIRPVLTKNEAEELIDNMPQIKLLEQVDEKKRELIYKDAIKSCDCKELIKIIKTLYKRRQDRIEDGKKFTAVDERYFNQAKGCLYGEIAIALDMKMDDVEDYITGRIEGKLS